MSQQELADLVGCSAALIRKVEAEERRPSRQIALLLIEQVRQPHEDSELLLRAARARTILDKAEAATLEPASTTQSLNLLTEREQNILRLLAADLTDTDIAESLSLKTSTVRWYVKQLYSKLGIHSRAEATEYADLLYAPDLAARPIPNNSHRSAARHLVIGLSQAFDKPYVGREKARIELTDALRARARLCSVYGRSGIGKTAMVCKVLADLLVSDSPPDGVLALGITTNQIGLAQVLSGFARLLGSVAESRLVSLSQNGSATAFEKAEALVDALTAGWYVLLLDNLESLQHPQTGELLDADLHVLFQVILEQGGLSIVVTSQRQMSLNRAQLVSERRISLSDGLPEDEAVEFLRQLDPDSSIGLREAPEGDLRLCAALVNGYPRALEAVAGILLEDPLLSVDALCRDTTWLKGELSAMVQQAMARLDIPSIQLLQALSIFPRPISVSVLSTILAGVMSNTTVRATLTQLVRGFYVHYSRFDQQVSLHPIDRDVAYRSIPQVEGDLLSRTTLHRRAIEICRQQRKPQQAWRIIDDLLPVLDEFEHWVALSNYDEAARLVLLIDRDYLWEWGQHGLLQSLHEKLIGGIQDGYLNRQHRRRLTWLRWKDNVQSAQKLFGSILDDARAAGDRQSEADVLDDLAQTDRRQMRFIEGLHKHQQALLLYREIGDQRGQADALGGIGSVLTYIDPDSAIAPFQEACAIHRAMGSTASLIYALNYLGVAHQAVGEFNVARTYLLESLEACSQHGLKVRESEAMQWLGMIALHQGNYEEAATWAHRLLALGQESAYLSSQQRLFVESYGCYLLGKVQFRQDTERGLALVRKAYDLAQQTQSIIWLITLGTAYATLLLEQRQANQVMEILSPLAGSAGADVRFWAVYIVAQIAAQDTVDPNALFQRIVSQVHQVPRQGRIPLWVQYPLTLLHTVADYWSQVDLSPRVAEFRALIERNPAPGLMRESCRLIEVLMEQPGGERLQPIFDVLRPAP